MHVVEDDICLDCIGVVAGAVYVFLAAFYVGDVQKRCASVLTNWDMHGMRVCVLDCLLACCILVQQIVGITAATTMITRYLSPMWLSFIVTVSSLAVKGCLFWFFWDIP